MPQKHEAIGLLLVLFVRRVLTGETNQVQGCAWLVLKRFLPSNVLIKTEAR